MDFVLGILTGIVLMIVYSQYLAAQQRKQQERAAKEAISAMRESFNILDGILRPRHHHNSLQQQLDDAIAREDFKEAARLRDLINKQ